MTWMPPLLLDYQAASVQSLTNPPRLGIHMDSECDQIQQDPAIVLSSRNSTILRMQIRRNTKRIKQRLRRRSLQSISITYIKTPSFTYRNRNPSLNNIRNRNNNSRKSLSNQTRTNKIKFNDFFSWYVRCEEWRDGVCSFLERCVYFWEWWSGGYLWRWCRGGGAAGLWLC